MCEGHVLRGVQEMGEAGERGNSLNSAGSSWGGCSAAWARPYRVPLQTWKMRRGGRGACMPASAPHNHSPVKERPSAVVP